MSTDDFDEYRFGLHSKEDYEKFDKIIDKIYEKYPDDQLRHISPKISFPKNQTFTSIIPSSLSRNTKKLSIKINWNNKEKIIELLYDDATALELLVKAYNKKAGSTYKKDKILDAITTLINSSK